MSRGIDVSSYNMYKDSKGKQVPIDWKQVKDAGVEFAILKAIRKDLSADKQFENNWNGCEESGVIVQGVYNYSYATTVGKAKADAQALLKVLADRKPMVWLDVEDKCQKGLGQALINIINAYGTIILKAGVQFGVYTGLSFYNSYIKPYTAQISCPFWIARYGKNDGKKYDTPSITDTLYGWQYTSVGSIPGISGNVDMNEWYVDLEAKSIAVLEEKAAYKLSNFILDSRSIWGVSDTAYANEIVSKTVTVSAAQNKTHAVVTPLERYMKALGYYQGNIEVDSGKEQCYGNGMKKAIKLYQEHIVKAKEKNRDGILTASGATWKTLYGAN